MVVPWEVANTALAVLPSSGSSCCASIGRSLSSAVFHIMVAPETQEERVSTGVQSGKNATATPFSVKGESLSWLRIDRVFDECRRHPTSTQMRAPSRSISSSAAWKSSAELHFPMLQPIMRRCRALCRMLRCLRGEGAVGGLGAVCTSWRGVAWRSGKGELSELTSGVVAPAWVSPRFTLVQGSAVSGPTALLGPRSWPQKSALLVGGRGGGRSPS